MISLQEILQDILAEKKLCPKGRAYYNRRRAAGEKPSAYLSGRAVKVCKGLMEEDDLDLHESLRDWFKKEDWVRIDTAGNITGPCGTMKKGKATTRCLPRAKANSLTKAERAATSRKKVAGSKKGKQFVPNTKKAKVNENKVDYYIDRYGNEFQTINVNYLQYPGSVTVKYTNSNEPVEYKGNFEADLKTGIIKRLNSEIDEAFFIGEDQTIECHKCGWRWKLADGGEDPYLCHKCNYDNSYVYQDGAIEEYDVESKQDIREFIEFMKEYQQQLNEADCDCLLEAKYQGRTVPLGKPMRGDSKKFKVYVKNPKTGKVVKVNFGAKGMNIKKNNPVRRKAFRARHNCANPGPRTKARYWSCRKW